MDGRAVRSTILISSCHWKALTHFCLQKEKPENAFLALIVIIAKSYRKTNYAIQQTVVRVYCILNIRNRSYDVTELTCMLRHKYIIRRESDGSNY